jgi:hypothetical protein
MRRGPGDPAQGLVQRKWPSVVAFIRTGLGGDWEGMGLENRGSDCVNGAGDTARVLTRWPWLDPTGTSLFIVAFTLQPGNKQRRGHF